LPRRTKLFVGPYLIDTLTETDTETDTETEMDMESDTETDTETNVEIDTTWTRTWTWGAIHRHEDIGRYSRYSAGWITGDTSQRKFQQRYEFVAPFPNENYDMLIEKKSYRH
jgi:hypothetical protein